MAAAARRAALPALAVVCLLPALAAGAERPLSLALVVDTSGSIAPADRLARKRVAQDVVRGLPAGSEVSVFAFDDKPRLVLPRTRDLNRVPVVVGNLRHRGRYTALYDAVYDASRYLGRGGPGRRAVLLVTDGVDENGALDLQDAVKMARDQHVAVSALGVGRVQDRPLRRLAKLTDGDYFAPRSRGSRIAPRLAATAAEAAGRSAPTEGPETADSAEPAPSPTPTVAPSSGPAPSLRATHAAASPMSPPPGDGKSTIWIPVLLVLGLAGLAGVAIALWLRSRGAADAPESLGAPDSLGDPAGLEGPSTLVTRFDALGTSTHQTMVLTLRPLLHVTRGVTQGRMYEVGKDAATSIGRADGNDVVVDDEAVSSQHCRIRPVEGGQFELIDLKSTNGTYLNERRVGRGILSPGDNIKVGQTVLQFRLDHLKG